LGEVLECNTSLTSLKLSCTEEGRKRRKFKTSGHETVRQQRREFRIGVKHIEERHQRRESISLMVPSCAGNEVNDPGAVRLGEALQCNTSLTSLDLSRTEGGREGMNLDEARMK